MMLRHSNVVRSTPHENGGARLVGGRHSGQWDPQIIIHPRNRLSAPHFWESMGGSAARGLLPRTAAGHVTPCWRDLCCGLGARSTPSFLYVYCLH